QEIGRLVRPCGGPTRKLNLPKNTGIISEWVQGQDQKITQRKDFTDQIIFVSGSIFKILAATPGGTQTTPLLGIALSSVAGEADDYAFPGNVPKYIHAGVGIIPGGSEAESPKSISFVRPWVFSSELYSVLDGQAPITDSLAAMPMRNYYFSDVNASIRPSSDYDPEIRKLVVDVFLNKGGQQSCMRGTIKYEPGGQDDGTVELGLC